jgi:hypothetical protein
MPPLGAMLARLDRRDHHHAVEHEINVVEEVLWQAPG